jgi:predicted GNAT family acetyltransferase
VVAALLRTPPYRLILSTCERPDALAVVANSLQATAPDLPGVTGLVPVVRAFAAHWQARTGIAGAETRGLRIYALRQVQPVAGVPGELRRATVDDRDRLVDWFLEFAAETATGPDRERISAGIDVRLGNPQGGLWFWEAEGEPVSLVGASGLTPHGIRIGPVYTPPEYRRYGYASAATAAVSQLLLAGGREFVFLYTDLANLTANHIYQAIGYEPVDDTVEIEFAPAPASGT